MGLIINGDIYIKKSPDYKELTIEEIEQLQLEREEIISNCDLPEEEIEKLNQDVEEMLEKGKPIFDGYRSFWIIILGDDAIKMVEQSSNGNQLVRVYKNLEEMEKEFISLRDLLPSARFYGKEFFTTEEIGEVLPPFAIEKMKSNPGPILTYVFGDRGITVNQKSNEFKMVDIREFISNSRAMDITQHDEYNKPSEVYQSISKQLYKKKRR